MRHLHRCLVLVIHCNQVRPRLGVDGIEVNTARILVAFRGSAVGRILLKDRLEGLPEGVLAFCDGGLEGGTGDDRSRRRGPVQIKGADEDRGSRGEEHGAQPDSPNDGHCEGGRME